MPRTTISKRPIEERERHFVNLYIKAGAMESSIANCERRTHLKAGSGKKILRRKAVQQEISARMEIVKEEQIRQKFLGEAVEKAERLMQEKLSQSVLAIQRQKIDLEVLDHELMTMVTGLDMRMHPKEKLDSIKAAYVVFGTLESGNTRRLIPPEHLQKNDGQGTYTSLFNRMALSPSPSDPTLESALDAKDGVFDVFPPSVGVFPKPMPPNASIPIMGESIDEPPASKDPSGIITVEVE
jgi:hypothetical protein